MSLVKQPLEDKVNQVNKLLDGLKNDLDLAIGNRCSRLAAQISLLEKNLTGMDN